MHMTEDGQRLFIAMNMVGKVVMLDTCASHKNQAAESSGSDRRLRTPLSPPPEDEKWLVISD
jgi:hypothetical protein